MFDLQIGSDPQSKKNLNKGQLKKKEWFAGPSSS